MEGKEASFGVKKREQPTRKVLKVAEHTQPKRRKRQQVGK